MRRTAHPHHTTNVISRASRRIGTAAILTNVVFWGAAPAIIKYGLEVIPPQVFLYYRFFLVLLITTPIFLFKKSLGTSIKKPVDLFRLLGIGIFTNPLNLGILFLGLKYTTSSSAAIIAGTAPLFIILGSAIFLRETIAKQEIAGVLIALAGMLFVILETPSQAHATHPLLGNLLVFVYNIVWTVGVLLMKRHANRYSPFLFGYTGWLMGFIGFGVLSAIFSPAFFLKPLMLTQIPQAALPILYMAIFGSIVAFTAYQLAQKHLPASEVSVFTYLQTAVAVPISLFWLNEQLGFFTFLGTGVVVLGVCIAEFHPSSRAKRLFVSIINHRR